MRYKIKRRGKKNPINYYLRNKYRAQCVSANNQMKYWRSLFIIAVLMVLTVITGFGYARADDNREMAATMSDKYHAEASASAKLAAQNAAYKEKLQGMFSATSSPQTQAIVNYYLSKIFGDKAEEARMVFTCESGLKPDVVSKPNTNGTVDSGIPQINQIHANRFQDMYGIPLATGSHDISLSLEYAKFLYDHQGWQPWTCARIVGLIK